MINNTFLKTAISIILLTILTACNNNTYNNKYELVNAVKSQIKEITVKDLKEKIAKQEEEFTLIDVRQANEFKEGNIEGSVSIPRGVLEFKISDDTFWEEEFMYAPADTSLIIIYCKSGSRGVLAIESLKSLGYKNVSNLLGGYKAFTSNIRREKLM